MDDDELKGKLYDPEGRGKNDAVLKIEGDKLRPLAPHQYKDRPCSLSSDEYSDLIHHHRVAASTSCKRRRSDSQSSEEISPDSPDRENIEVSPTFYSVPNSVSPQTLHSTSDAQTEEGPKNETVSLERENVPVSPTLNSLVVESNMDMKLSHSTSGEKDAETEALAQHADVRKSFLQNNSLLTQ